MKIVLSVPLVLIVLVHLQSTACIVNRKRNNSSAPRFHPRRETYKQKSYLHSNRPLWVLEDKVNHPGEINIPFRRPSSSVQIIKKKQRFLSPVITSSPKLPSHYINLGPFPTLKTVPKARIRKNSKNQRIFPVFDNSGTESDSVFIYRGAKAKMIFNTMMSGKKYPMQEPVPGEVLYPPYSPKFKPTPVVEQDQSESFVGTPLSNLTLIPFYTHEASIDPRLGLYAPFSDSDSDTIDKTNVAVEEPSTKANEEDCHNCYHSFYSQNDVQWKYWSLPHITPAPESSTPMNLKEQVDVPSGFYSNHRTEETTPISVVTSGDQFRRSFVNQEDDSHHNERYRSVLSAKYGGFKTVYPIYTLNKLLRYKPLKKQNVDLGDEGSLKKLTAPEEMWLVWNSRNREAHKSNYQNSVSIRDLPRNHKISRMIDHKLMIK